MLITGYVAFMIGFICHLYTQQVIISKYIAKLLYFEEAKRAEQIGIITFSYLKSTLLWQFSLNKYVEANKLIGLSLIFM